ncbi:MAG: energy transducer TonB [Saprospiraceae bacterium]|nr:energy transducer TonB [Saprospiraceae bacterium]
MDVVLDKHEKENQRKGMLTSVVIHTFLIALILLPILTFPDPPPGQEGILVNLGADFGQGDENAPEQSAAAVTEPIEETVPEEETEATTDPNPDIAEVETPVTKETPAPEKEVIQTEDPAAIALKKKKAEEEAQKKKAEEDQKKKDAADAARKKKEAEEAEAKRLAEEAAYKEAKDKYTNTLGGGTGDGKGDTGNPGNQGDANGDPNASALEGVSTGTGQVGGGLGNRGVTFKPTVRDNSQKQGIVVIKVCVDSDGNVLSAEFTQAGSTTVDSSLKSIAIEAAKKWKFSSSSVSKQCGTIQYDFKVK